MLQIPWMRIGRLRPLHWLLLLMLVSYGLRLALVHQGGQLFKPDEWRYLDAARIAHNIRALRLADALDEMLRYESHPGAKAAFILPALLHRLVYASQPENEQSWDLSWELGFGDFRLSAAFLALPSVLSIGLIYLIARRSGGDEREALLTAFVLAASNSWLISSRHLLPYDISLCLTLVAWAVSLRRRTDNWTLGMLVGFLLCLQRFLRLYELLAAGRSDCLAGFTDAREMLARDAYSFCAVGAGRGALAVDISRL